MNRLRTLWSEHRLILLGFVAAMLLVLFFAVRAIFGVVYWSQHREAPIEYWMTIGYIAHSYDVNPKVLGESLGLNRDEAMQKPVGKIAEDADMEFPRIRSEILTIIDAERQRKQHD